MSCLGTELQLDPGMLDLFPAAISLQGCPVTAFETEASNVAETFVRQTSRLGLQANYLNRLGYAS